MDDSTTFISALRDNNLNELRKIPKADLHNHFVLGGNRVYIKQKTGSDILPIITPLYSMNEIHTWSSVNIGKRFESREMRQLLIDASFEQAKLDGVSVLEIGEDVWVLGMFFNHDINALIDVFEQVHRRTAPDIELRLRIGVPRRCGINYLLSCLEPFWGRKELYSIDLYGDELAQPIKDFVSIYQKAKEHGLKFKAHIGEWGTSDDVIQGIELLLFGEVQHGILATVSNRATDYLLEHQIRLNITPSSSVLLGRAVHMKEHPIVKLFRVGLDVTVNSDDVLTFDSDVSKEYLSLHNNHVLEAKELDWIRLNGLREL